MGPLRADRCACEVCVTSFFAVVIDWGASTGAVRFNHREQVPLGKVPPYPFRRAHVGESVIVVVRENMPVARLNIQFMHEMIDTRGQNTKTRTHQVVRRL